MKPLRKIVMILMSIMLLCSDINCMPVHATTIPDTTPPETDTTPDTDTTPETDTTPDTDTDTTPGTDTTTPEDPGTTPDPQEPEEPVYIPSSNNYLSSLSIEGFDLVPAFDTDTQEYSLEIDASNTQVEIKASVQDSRASVSGTGTFDVSWEVGAYDFKIVVRAENGYTRNYVIHLNVSSEPYLSTVSGGETLWFVIKGLDDLVPPEGFEMTDGSYGGDQITMFSNESFPFNLVYLQKDNKKQDWYCYENGLVTGLFRKLVINKTVYYYAGISDEKKQEGYSYSEVDIQGDKLNGWKVNSDSNKIMLYLYDTMGNSDYYVYDTEDGTMQRRREFEVTETKENRSFLKSPVTITVMIVVVIAAIFIVIFLKDGKKKDGLTLEKIKEKADDYDDTKFDNTVELVRTGKVKIFADPVENPEIEKTKEFNFDLKEVVKEEPTKIEEDPFVNEEELPEIEEELPQIEEETLIDEINLVDEESLKALEIETTEDIQETETVLATSVVEEEKPKEKKSFFKKNKDSKEGAKEKKGFFAKKKKKQEESITPLEEEVIEEVVEDKKVAEEKIEEKPIVFVANREEISEVDEVEAIQEIQKYIDNLFYLDENEKA